jgi:hypothetical protein
MRLAGINITTTLIRGDITTECYDMLLDGNISNRDLNAVNNINGHSGATARQHYLYRDRQRDAREALAVSRRWESPSDRTTEQPFCITSGRLEEQINRNKPPTPREILLAAQVLYSPSIYLSIWYIISSILVYLINICMYIYNSLKTGDRITPALASRPVEPYGARRSSTTLGTLLLS